MGILPSSVVVVILSLLGEGKTFSSDKNFLYEKFFDLSKTFPSLFQDFIFDESKIYPKCEIIDFAIDKITGFGMVEWKNLGDDYIILPAMIKRGKELMAGFSAAERIQLSAAEKFAEMIKDHYKKCNCEG
ncbi:MAG: hypothetical protein HW401_32 [Parcubacteria group bacterium]|nr:hypothetical protein [Parcubacteria group bacterium]